MKLSNAEKFTRLKYLKISYKNYLYSKHITIIRKCWMMLMLAEAEWQVEPSRTIEGARWNHLCRSSP